MKTPARLLESNQDYNQLIEVHAFNRGATDDAAILDKFRRWLVHPAHEAVGVHTKDGDLIGYAFGCCKNTAVVINCVWVDPRYRRLGLATAMVSLLMSQPDFARRKRAVTLLVDDDHGPEYAAFYESLGFELSTREGSKFTMSKKKESVR